MPNTYTQMYAQVVFSPKGRQNLILSSFEEAVYKYIASIIKEYDQKPIAIGGMLDHLHVFFGFKPTVSIADLVSNVKTGWLIFLLG